MDDNVIGLVAVTLFFGIPLAAMYTHARTLHLVDGPDEVHKQQIARRELRQYDWARA